APGRQARRELLPRRRGGLTMPAAGTPKLLGTYRTPRFEYGDVVTCARRGDVRIVGLSEAPIPWPIGQTLPRGRARALVLYGDLAGAVRRESAEAVGRRRLRRLAEAQGAGRRPDDRGDEGAEERAAVPRAGESPRGGPADAGEPRAQGEDRGEQTGQGQAG